MSHNSNKWFSVRSIYKHTRFAKQLYEERIVMFFCESIDKAVAEAEMEAAAYASMNDCEAGDLFSGYDSGLDVVASKSEVFSLMRESDLEMGVYIDQFFDTGRERSTYAVEKYEGAHLMSIAYGVEPMTRTISSYVMKMVDVLGCGNEAVARALTDSHLNVAEAYQLGAALHEKAKTFLKR